MVLRESHLRFLVVMICVSFFFTSVFHDILEMNELRNISFEELFPESDVHIWAKWGIADYLWFHLLNGTSSDFYDGAYNYGDLSFDDIYLEYFGGPGSVLTNLPQLVEYLIIALDGHTKENLVGSLIRLEYTKELGYLKKLAVILLGDENCENDWITKYLRSRGGPIDVLFLIYDSPLVDNREIYQWPLGVTVSRHFPKYDLHKLNLNDKRKYLCSFVESVDGGSSGKLLRSILNNSSFKHNCLLADRNISLAQEALDNLERYIDVLKSSDYTLCPAEINAETNRVYDAMSLGSIPIIEDKKNSGQCVLPLRLLKKYNAPVIFIKDWIDLNRTLARWDNFSLIQDHRMRVAKWYKDFQNTMAQHFIDIINNTFFHSET